MEEHTNLLGLPKIAAIIFLFFAPVSFLAQDQSLKFLEKKIASESFESVGVFDVNNDKILDLISGSYWYEGPGFLVRKLIGQSDRFGEYYDDFATIPMDINGDGKVDYVTGAWFKENLRWYENLADGNEWPEHIISETGNIETLRAWDINKDGVKEIVPNTPNDSLTIYQLVLDENNKGTSVFKAYKIFGKHGHGLGYGDLNGDGRGDFIVAEGWLEAPENPFRDKWVFHQEFKLGKASVPIIVADINKDGLKDFIVGQGHDYGLHWYEQKRKTIKKASDWVKHGIDSENSQFHTMEWADLDGDGINELITGKRYRAHNGKDPGNNDAYGIYYYKWNGKNFTKHIIAYGVFGETKGTGIYFEVIDLNGNGSMDIVVAGKDGLYVFYNQGY